jgi:hypothetical protein
VEGPADRPSAWGDAEALAELGQPRGLAAQGALRSLKDEPIVYLYLDAITVKVRLAQRVVSRPILVAVGVREDGQKVLLGLWSKGSESTASWKDVLEDLERRGLKRPLLAIIDGCGGLRAAMEQVWPGLEGTTLLGAQASQPPSARAPTRAR